MATRSASPFLAINFVAQRRWISGRGVLVSILGLAALLAALADYSDFAERAARLQGKIDHFERQLATLSRARESETVKMDLAEWRSLRQVSSELNYPWVMQMQAIERALGENIAILSIQPEPKNEQLRITGEAKSLADAVEFAGRLKTEAGFQSVSVIRHEYRQVGAVRILGFVIVAR